MGGKEQVPYTVKTEMKGHEDNTTYTVIYVHNGVEYARHTVNENSDSIKLTKFSDYEHLSKNGDEELPCYEQEGENEPQNKWETRPVDDTGKVIESQIAPFHSVRQYGKSVVVYSKICTNDNAYNIINHYGLPRENEQGPVQPLHGPYCPLKFKRYKITSEFSKFEKLFNNSQETSELSHMKEQFEDYKKDRKIDLFTDAAIMDGAVGKGNGFTAIQKKNILNENWLRKGGVDTDVSASLYAFGKIGDILGKQPPFVDGAMAKAGNKKYYLIVQSDGNLKVIEKGKWETTGKKKIKKTEMPAKNSQNTQYNNAYLVEEIDDEYEYHKGAVVYKSQCDTVEGVKEKIIKTYRSDHDDVECPTMCSEYSKLNEAYTPKKSNNLDYGDNILVQAEKSQKAVVPAINEAQVDHIHPENWGVTKKQCMPSENTGSNSYCNAAVISRIRNGQKSNHTSY